MEQNQLPATQKKALPKIADLYENKELAIKENELLILCNQAPKKEWIRQHPFIKAERVINNQKVSVPYEYLPIETVEFLLTMIFGTWSVDIKSVQLIANSVVVTVRLSATSPSTGELLSQDGVGASPLQTDKDAGACQFDRIKSGAVMMAAPAAESYAIKDAAEKFGKLFGKDLNRKDEMGYGFLDKKFDSVPLNS